MVAVPTHAQVRVSDRLQAHVKAHLRAISAALAQLHARSWHRLVTQFMP